MNMNQGMNPNFFANMTPIQMQMMQYQMMMQQQMMIGNNNFQSQRMPLQNGGLAPGMMNPLQPRASIPENNSSFNFISNGSQTNYSNSNLNLSGSMNNGGTTESEDAFGFVREAMKGK